MTDSFKQQSCRPPKFNPPGPSPWYLRGKKIETKTGVLTWFDYGNHGNLGGVSRLQTADAKVVMLLNFYCYVCPLGRDRVLLWYENSKQDNPGPNPIIHFEIIDLCAVTPITDPEAEAERMRKERRHRVFLPFAHPEFTCLSALAQGRHPLTVVPPAFTEIEETLVLADYRPEGKTSGSCRAIFAFDFRSAQVDVLPQDWFNKGSYDFGYQWITRVARDPETQRIFGDGIRLGLFRLDETGKKVEEWFVKDPFYGPYR